MRFAVIAGLLAAGLASAANWSFEDATVQVQESRGEAGSKTKFSADKAITKELELKSTGFIRVALTITNGGKPRQPHQAFVAIKSPASGLEESFPMKVDKDGKAKLDVKFADIPSALLNKSLEASIVIGSFGSSKALRATAFSFAAPSEASATASPPTRYTAQPEIHHIFKDDPKSPAKILSLVFTFGVLACLPVLLIAWGMLGANMNHLQKALGAAPVSHALFFGSIIGMEWVFWQYYVSWRLFTMLPVAGVFGVIAFLSGSGALTEVQERRLNGER
ncbi:hypothetical protein BT63DRAFT_392659 [Microthyrium microscopicum]|uniref:Ribophorin II n=1 Tax=Microthyrium microscopicum TaxID=703497 RepID=A0A6A6U0V9_9PEZI|nr:hypothetical protein BT63DRAFT_392659 [Microthyrium microscopicum]